MRRIATIQSEEQHFFDLIWYDRKLVMLENIRQGIEPNLAEDHMDQVTGAMREIEAKYEALKGAYHNDFEWGMINGKLSALRWVLGDEWDNLDT